MNDTVETAEKLAAEHREGTRDPAHTARHGLDRAQRLQPVLNAFACIDEAGAIEAAHRHGREGALAGVPVSVKDILDVAGLPTRWGSPLMRDAPPAKADVEIVARLRAAGAVIIGKTTTTEFAHSPLGLSPLTGMTRNPWAERLTCGGSSAGAGVSVAAGITPLALATDAGCSTRLPAACTGTFGLKPTLGRLPHDRVPEGFANFIHLGLIAAAVPDLALALDALAGPHRADPHSLGHAPPNAHAGLQQPVLEGARVVLWMRAGNAKVAAEIVAATRRAAAMLERLGARVTEQEYPLGNPDAVWRVLQHSNWAARFAAQPPEQRATLSPALRSGIEEGLACKGLELQRALTQRTEIFRRVQAVFVADADFILTPCTAAPPVPADSDPAGMLLVDGEEAGSLRSAWTPYLSLFDLSGHPAIALPAGLAESRAPLGVQLVAPWGADAALLAAAHAYERLAPPPRWRAPP